MSNDRKIFELITKLIVDTYDGRITWSENCNRGKIYGNHDKSFVADYDNLYRLDFCVVWPKETSYRLKLLESDGNVLLDIDNINSMSDLHDAILSQYGHDSKGGRDSKADEAIEHILQT